MPHTTEAAGRADYTRAFKSCGVHLSAALAVCVLHAFEKTVGGRLAICMNPVTCDMPLESASCAGFRSLPDLKGPRRVRALREVTENGIQIRKPLPPVARERGKSGSVWIQI